METFLIVVFIGICALIPAVFCVNSYREKKELANNPQKQLENFEQENYATLIEYQRKSDFYFKEINNKKTDLRTKLEYCEQAVILFNEMKEFCSKSDVGMRWYASSAERVEKNVYAAIQDIKNCIAIEERHKEEILSAFHTEGWNIWGDEIHDQWGQSDRIERSYEQTFDVLAFNSNARLALLSGTKGDHYFTTPSACTCPDFMKRGLPCKHLYYLCRVATKPGFFAPDKIPADGLCNIPVSLAGKFSFGTHAAVKAFLEGYEAGVKSGIYEGIAAIIEGKNVTESTQNKAIELHIMQIKEVDLFPMLETAK